MWWLIPLGFFLVILIWKLSASNKRTEIFDTVLRGLNSDELMVVYLDNREVAEAQMADPKNSVITAKDAGDALEMAALAYWYYRKSLGEEVTTGDRVKIRFQLLADITPKKN